jgi:uncharacterized membrane protein
MTTLPHTRLAVQTIPAVLSSAAVRQSAATLALAAVLLMAAVFRFTGLNWDENHYLHPDERFMTMVATGIAWPKSVGEYFDSRVSPLNPYNRNFGTYVYGTFPLFLGKAVAGLFNRDAYGSFHLPARALSATFDLLSVLLVYLIGRRLFGTAAGLLAALLLSLTVLHIQAAHFFTTDVYVTTLCLATFYFALRACDRCRWLEYTLAGIMAGLALASKLSVLPIVAVLALPLAERWRLAGWRAALVPDEANDRGLPFSHPLIGTGLALLCVVLTFRIAQPYAFAEPGFLSLQLDPRWVGDVQMWSKVQSGAIDMPPSHQWAGREPVWYVVRNLVLWGMGLPLGITALLALTLGGVSLAMARRWPPAWQFVLVGWPAFHILYYGTGLIKTVRYLLPAYPFLVLLAAGFLTHWWLNNRAPPAVQSLRQFGRLRFLGAAATAVVVLGTALYALAFTGIYTRPVTRVAASDWIYAHLPKGTVVANEHWDDPLPLPRPGRNSADYPGVQLELYNEDNEEKLRQLLERLDRAQYIFVTSNRLYGSIPRLPQRYPMTIEYYKMLFSGELGFSLEKTFTSYPQLFGIQLNDDGADESFTVYDHPKVLIFKKTAAYSRAAIEQRLRTALERAGDIVPVRPVQAGKNLLMLSERDRLIQQAGGTWRLLFDRASLSNQLPPLFWYLAMQLMALAAAPLCWRLLGGLPDRGYAVAKSLGLLLTGYVAWLLPSLRVLPFGPMAILAGILVTAALSLALVWPRRAAFWGDLRRSWRSILWTEALFLVAFAAFVWIRALNPDLWHRFRGGEKPMEFAYFNAVLRSTYFPPYDPWFAGGYLNYYYFGYVLMGVLTRLTGIVPAVAFNLAVPTVFALMVVNSWAFVTAVLHRLRGEPLCLAAGWLVPVLGLLGALFVAVLGNLDMVLRISYGQWGYPPVRYESLLPGVGVLVRIALGVWHVLTVQRLLPSDIYWPSSRVIKDTINEFPYFSFLFADLHPHMMALPFTVAALLVALGILGACSWPARPAVEAEPAAGGPPPWWFPFWRRASPAAPDRPLFGLDRSWRAMLADVPWRAAAERVGLTALAGLVAGGLLFINSWDYPTYLLLLVAAFAVAEFAAAGWTCSFSLLRRVALWAGLTVVLSRLFYWPYLKGYELFYSSFLPWRERSLLSDYLTIHGVFLFFVVSFFVAELVLAEPRAGVVRLGRLALRHWGRLGRLQSLYAALVGNDQDVSPPSAMVVGAMGCLVLLAAVLLHQLFWFFLGMLFLAGAVAWQRRHDPVRLFLAAMVALATLLSMAVELYTLEGDIGRMNTVFKFYLQIWVMLGLVAAVGAATLLVRMGGRTARPLRLAWLGTGMLLVAGALVYPLLATPARLADRFSPLPPTLDGMAYMPHALYEDTPEGRQPVRFSLAGDYRALNWLLDHVDGSPVVLEANIPLYRWGSRVTVYTGLPTVLGWDWHQTQQRAGYKALIDRRKQDIQRMLGERTSFEAVRPLLDKYHVKYIYVGDLERAYYDAAALQKFEDAAQRGLVQVVYRDGGVTIYRYDGARG